MNTVPNAVAVTGPDSRISPDWVEDYGDYLFNFALGQVHDRSVAEDLVQETFLAALKARDKFAGKSAERTWLVGILRHKIYDHLRQTCRNRARLVPAMASERPDEEVWDQSVFWLHTVAAECESPSRRMELDEFRTHLERALGELPPRLAQVFQLYAMEERSNPEVCEQLKISESNLWVMLHRARKQLRDQLSVWWRGEATEPRSSRAQE